MTTSEAATIAAIRKQAAERLRQTADALALIQSPLGRPQDNPAISELLAQRSRDLFNAVRGKILTVSEAAEALNLSRQRVYVLLAEEGELRHQATYELQEAVKANTSSNGLAQLLKVATNIARAQALPASEIMRITGWTQADLFRLSQSPAANPARTQLPETDL